jgi:lipopolysaccharide assembly protein A
MTDTSEKRDNGFVRFLKRKWLAIILVILLIIIAIQNGVADETSKIFLLFWHVEWPTWVVVLLVFIIGGVVGWIFARNRAARKARR